MRVPFNLLSIQLPNEFVGQLRQLCLISLNQSLYNLYLSPIRLYTSAIDPQMNMYLRMRTGR